MNKHLRLLAALAAFFLIALLFSGCYEEDEQALIPDEPPALAEGAPRQEGVPPGTDEKLMTIHFIDVGQGDSIFIDFGDYEILIDAGLQKYGKAVANYIADFVEPPIELVIATHPDADHIGGFPEIINMFDIEKILYNGMPKNTVTYKTFEVMSGGKQDCEFIVAEDAIFDMGNGASIEIITPVKRYKDVNDNSIVAVLRYNDVSILLTGDMEAKSEADLLDRFSQTNVLKAAHHGSRTSSSVEFLDRINPECVIISAGLGNVYNHPHHAALQRLIDTGATVYGTQKDGTITMSTDGNTYSVTATAALTLADAGDN